jgi:hypothetical protein
MAEVQYKGRHIEMQSYRSDGGRWRPKAVVITSDGGSVHTELLFGPLDAMFETQGEADAYAVRMAHLWIDERD